MNNKNNIFLKKLDYLIGEKFGNYSKYIIQERALPDLRDGLKPVQRRILYAMNDMKLSHKSPYKKSARVVGDVIGKYHPHGDSSVYEAMVRLGQEWKLNIPLVDMHGNKGSIDGDSPAAMRYTEIRLSHISEYLLLNLEKELVNFSPNFDDSELEPTVLPAKFPNLLVNGSIGIASGYSTNIPPHNIVEVIKALIYVLKNQSVTLSNLTKYIKGPDFPTGGIVNIEDVKNAYKTGKGKVIIRAKIKFDEKNNELHILEIPFEVNKADLVRKIDELIKLEKIPGILGIRDDTDRSGLQITILLKPKVNVTLIINFLYKNTDLQKNYNLNMVAIKEKKPEQLSLLDIITSFASFQIQIYTNLYKYELNKLNDRLEIVEGLIIVVDIIDEIIKLIRKSTNKMTAKESIIKNFNFTDRQAEAIVNLRLYRLTSTDINQLQEEKKILNKGIMHFSKGLENEIYLKSNIISELEEIINIFPIKRRSKLDNSFEEINISEKDLIVEERVVVTVSYQGYIKKISLRSRELSEGKTGRGEEDIIISIFETSNMDNLVLFSSKGRYYVIPIYKLKDNKWKDVGYHVSNFTNIDGTEKILAVAYIKDFNFANKVIFSTKNGLIKQTNVSNLILNSSKRGAKYITLKEEDEVISVLTVDSQDYFAISTTKMGNTLKYSIDNIPQLGLSASGVKNIKIDLDDKVVSTIVQPILDVDTGKSQVLFFTKNGKAKRIRSRDIKGLTRGSKGSKIIKQSKNNPTEIFKLFNIDNLKEIFLLSKNDNYQNFIPKTNTLISEVGSGLTTVTKEGIKEALIDSTLFFNKKKLNDKDKKNKNSNESNFKQIDLNNILNDF